MEPMKYWSFSSSTSAETRRFTIDKLLKNSEYIAARKYDGNWSRGVITSGRNALQTRGISKKTGTYGEVQNKVCFWEDVVKTFEDCGDTVILGEIYLEGGIDKNVGSILRSLDEKAKSIQDEDYYNGISKSYKFSAKDKRDIENNEFRNKKLQWRIFDVLSYKGQSLMKTPMEERVKYIEKVVSDIGSPLVRGLKYFEADDSLWDKLTSILAEGGEGLVMSKKTMIYEPGKRGPHSYDTIKLKAEMATEADLFITGVCAPEEEYKGKEIFTWQLWEDLKTGEKLEGQYYTQYHTGERALRPISKNYYNSWPSAIVCSAWDDNHNPVVVCKCAGLDEEFKTELRDNFDKYYMMPVKISGMQVSDDGSIRHPRLVSLRDGDISTDDCLLSKLL